MYILDFGRFTRRAFVAVATVPSIAGMQSTPAREWYGARMRASLAEAAADAVALGATTVQVLRRDQYYPSEMDFADRRRWLWGERFDPSDENALRASSKRRGY